MGEKYPYQNPVIRGFNPDPSVCRVGDDFYLVTSSFEYFPGVPIYHSRNLVNWELIGHCLTDVSQLNLAGCRASGGIYAPTIRYSDGIFYMVTTNVSDRGNFIVHTRDIRGRWSEPVWIDQGGIDPSLLFDEDGSVYFCSNGYRDGDHGIFACRINPFTGEKTTPSTLISTGCGGKSPEAPHIYHIGGYYYLMLAEGGTEYGHMVTLQRSRDIFGPYEPCPDHPILSHRDHHSPIQATGHADLTDDQYGNWWLFCLGIRPLEDMFLHNLGRETFLTPVAWKDEWPVIGDRGTIAPVMEAELPAAPEKQSFDFHDDFDGLALDLNWNFIRNPEPSACTLTKRKGCVTLTGGETGLSTCCASPAFIGVRQPEFEIEATAKMFCAPQEGQKSGMTAFAHTDYHYDLYLTREEGKDYVCLSKRLFDLEAVTAKREIPDGEEIQLQITADRKRYRFSFRRGEEPWMEMGTGMTAGLCTECTHEMTFTGTFLGLFSVGGCASFDSFRLWTL